MNLINDNKVVRGRRTSRGVPRRFPAGLFRAKAATPTPSPPQSGSSGSEYMPDDEEEEESEGDSLSSGTPIPLRRTSSRVTRSSSTRPAVIPTPCPSTNDGNADVLMAMFSGQYAALRSPSGSPSRTTSAILGISSVVALKKKPLVPYSDSSSSSDSSLSLSLSAGTINRFHTECEEFLMAIKPTAVAADVTATGGSRLRPRSLALASDSGGGMGSSGTSRLRARVAEIVGLVKAKALRPLPAYLRLTEFISDPDSVSELLRAYGDVVGWVGFRATAADEEKVKRFTEVASSLSKVAGAVNESIDKCLGEIEIMKSLAEQSFERVIDHLGIEVKKVPLLRMLYDLWDDGGKINAVEVIDGIIELDQ